VDIDLRQAVINNMKGADSATVSSTIADAIQVKKEQLFLALECYLKFIGIIFLKKNKTKLLI